MFFSNKKNLSSQSDVDGATGEIIFEKPEGVYGRNFDRIFLSEKNMFSGSMFDADSEYHIHFGRRQKYNGENWLIRAGLVASCP